MGRRDTGRKGEAEGMDGRKDNEREGRKKKGEQKEKKGERG